MHAEIVTTGTEILLGLITDTNSLYIARRLREIGLNLYYITSAGDNRERVAGVIDAALNRSDVVITTGGLGPTVGDITREAVAQATGRELVFNPRLLASIEAYFARRGRQMSENNRRQARIPAGAIPVENPVGTAPAFIVEDPRGIVISLPGVPREMKYLMTHAVIPYLRKKLGLHQVIKTRILKTCCIGESDLDARIADLEQSANPTVGLAAHPGQCEIRITAKADDEALADAMLDEVEARIRERVGDYIYGTDDDELPTVVLDQLRRRGLSISTAEVGIGGLLSSWLTAADPQGEVFRGGWVLPASHSWTLGEESAVPLDDRQESLRLANAICTVTGAEVGLAVLNVGPEQTHLVAVHEDLIRRQEIPFRGHGSRSNAWIASLALGLVRQML